MQDKNTTETVTITPNFMFFQRNELVNRIVRFFFSFPENEGFKGNQSFSATNYYDDNKVSYQFIKTIFQFFESKRSSKNKEYFTKIAEKENIPGTFHEFITELKKFNQEKDPKSSFLDFSVPNYEAMTNKKGPPPSKQWQLKTEQLKKNIQLEEYNEMVYPVLHSNQSNKFFKSTDPKNVDSTNEDIRLRDELSSSIGAGFEILLTMATLGFLFYMTSGLITRHDPINGPTKRLIWTGFGLILGFVVQVILIVIKLNRRDEALFANPHDPKKKKVSGPQTNSNKLVNKKAIPQTKKKIQVLPPRIKEEEKLDSVPSEENKKEIEDEKNKDD